MALAFGLHSLGASGSPTFSGSVTARALTLTTTAADGITFTDGNEIQRITWGSTGPFITVVVGTGHFSFSQPIDAPAISLSNGVIAARNANGGFSFGSAGTQFFGMSAGSQTINTTSATQAFQSGTLQFDNASSVQGPSSHLLYSGVAPTISSGFGASPSIVASNGTLAFQVNVGTGGSATSGVIGLPTAANGWVLLCVDITSTAVVTHQTASTTTTATIGSFNAATGAALAWAASDKVNIIAVAY